ncbi:Autophagy-related protein 17 [Neolecta irregularis DAH-3]|uniref:Autophagy-related protein 17 n=1 Tax=Neolecta irregularis (strain DAH-3) TaxID=1198029 RepID=A0A1U7LUG4_NEOID|nr:Autophagy-related protein 17 [Neolecta irregularis DAH-3]|eukprot:OLL26316.1 Autophagy-related protein 17 [Neolecta irregularis DAH-3]
MEQPQPAPILHKSHSTFLHLFTSAKKALAIAGTLGPRAEELETSTTESLDKCAALEASYTYLCNGIRMQISLAEKLLSATIQSQENSRKEFEARLKSLKETKIDPGLEPENGVQTLYEFVDEMGIEKLRTTLRESVDGIQDARDILSKSISSAQADFSSTQKQCLDLPPLPSLKSPTITESIFGTLKNRVALLPQQLHRRCQERHVHHMASIINSLTNHFDNCSQALKEENMERSRGALEVLEKDARQVDAALDEMHHRIEDMVRNNELARKYYDEIEMISRKANDAVTLLEQFGSQVLSRHLAQLDQFQAILNEQNSQIEKAQEEMSRLADYYRDFTSAYDALILEIERRQNMKAKMEKVVKDALATLEAMHDDELHMREQFREERGDFLPSNIWPGISDPPTQYEIVAHEEGNELIQLSQTTIDGARHRLYQRERQRSRQI